MEYITRIKVNGERKEISPEEASEILKKTVELPLWKPFVYFQHWK